jgi:hypothetical protein
LRLLLRIRRACKLNGLRRSAGMGIAEGIDANDWIGAVVFLALVKLRLFLDFAALVACFHGT